MNINGRRAEFRNKFGRWPKRSEIDTFNSVSALNTDWMNRIDVGTVRRINDQCTTLEKVAEEIKNMKMWGRKDDPRLDPTSEFYDPLKLVYKDIE